jgi:hypothetical protein
VGSSTLLLLLFVAKSLDIVHLLRPKTKSVLEIGPASVFRWSREMGEPTLWFEAHFFKFVHQGRFFRFPILRGDESRAGLQNRAVESVHKTFDSDSNSDSFIKAQNALIMLNL